MAKLPVLWVQASGVERIVRVGHRMDSTGVSTAQLSAVQRGKFIEYLPAKRCKTCARYNPPTKGNPAYGWCHSVRDEIERVPSDGSGFCHNHEDVE